MTILKTVITGSLTTLVIAGLGFYVVANHSVNHLELTCSGNWLNDNRTAGPPETVAVVIERYRPWVIWTDNHGNITAESRDVPVMMYASKLQEIGTSSMPIFEFKHDVTGPVVGRYRAAFKELTLTFGTGMDFRGTCEVAHA